MRRRELSLERVVATTVHLLDRTLIRVGNSEYSGDSYGLTTLLDDHVDIGVSRPGSCGTRNVPWVRRHETVGANDQPNERRTTES